MASSGLCSSREATAVSTFSAPVMYARECLATHLGPATFSYVSPARKRSQAFLVPLNPVTAGPCGRYAGSRGGPGTPSPARRGWSVLRALRPYCAFVVDAVKDLGERKCMTYLKTVDAQKKYQRLLAIIGRLQPPARTHLTQLRRRVSVANYQSIAVSVNKVAFC